MDNADIGYTAEQIDELMKHGELERLGIGSRRACYRLPDVNLCVKCYRSDDEIAEGKYPGNKSFKPLLPSVVREIHNYRFDDQRNTSCQEYRYWEKLQRRLPKDLMDVFPATMEKLLLPSRGWCVVEELLTNADGTPVAKFHEEWFRADHSMRTAMLAAFDVLAKKLVQYAVRMFDPQDIMVQKDANGSVRLRISDFEPVSRVFLPIDHLSNEIVRMKVRRRLSRYRRIFDMQQAVASQPHCKPLENSDSAVNVMCMKWGSYYTPDYVNKLYAGVKRNLRRPFRFVCVTDDPSGLAVGIESVPFPPDPQVPGRNATRLWPNIFAKLALFKDGFANLSGPTLFLDLDVLVTGSLDRFFNFKPGEFCIIHNWVEKRKSLFRKLPPIGNSSCFRFEAGKSGGVWEVFQREKDIADQGERFCRGSQKFQTYAMMKTGKVNWWPSDWVCSFKRQLVPIFPFNKILCPRRPPRKASIVAFHGRPDLPQALAGYYVDGDKPVKPHLTCKPTKWILEYWRE